MLMEFAHSIRRGQWGWDVARVLACLACMISWVQLPTPQKPGIKAYANLPSTPEVEAEGSEVCSHEEEALKAPLLSEEQ